VPGGVSRKERPVQRVGEETYLGGAFVMMSDLYGKYNDEN
jgi:hypothetical protein